MNGSALNPKAILLGALVSAVVTVPVSLLAPSDRNDDSYFLLFGLFLVGFVVGGAVTAWREPDFPFVNGALAPALMVVVVQGIGAVRRVAVGENVNWFGFLFLIFLAGSCGAVGAAIAYRVVRGRTPDEGADAEQEQDQ